MPAYERKTAYKSNKTNQIKALQEKLEKAKAFFLTDYRGLTHPQLEQLRRALKKAEGEFVIAKNTLIRIALKEGKNTGMQELIEELKNPTAAFFAFGDEIAAIKELAKFIKNTQLPKIKIGLFAQKLATESDFKKLASLPTKDVLLSTLVFRLKSPLYGLHYALNWNLQRLVIALDNIKNKK